MEAIVDFRGISIADRNGSLRANRMAAQANTADAAATGARRFRASMSVTALDS
jgi:hypothetical protein